MKIFVLESDINNSLNGLRHHFINKLIKLNHKVFIAGGSPYETNFINDNYDDSLKVNNVNFNTFNPLILIKTFFKLFYLCLKYRPDHVIVYNIRPIVIWGIINKFFNITSTCTITGTITISKHGKIKPIYKKLINSTIRKFKYVVFQNDFDFDLFENLGKNYNQVRKIINGSGVDIDHFKLDYKSNKKWDFIFIGRLIKEKGIIEYLKASKKLLSTHPNLKFCIIGSTYKKSKNNSHLPLDELKKYLIDKKIVYLGESNDIKKHLSNSKCLILPSYGEGFSNVLLEAGAMGLPLITTNVPGCKDIVTNSFNGFLCSPRNVSDLKNKIINYINLSKKDKDNFGKNSREFVVNNFSKDIIINQYVSLLNLK